VLTSAAQTEAAGRFVVELRDGSVAARTDVDTDEE